VLFCNINQGGEGGKDRNPVLTSGKKGTKISVVTVVKTSKLTLFVLTGRSNQYVTCGSVLKLMNTGYKVRLHSHDVKYGTGSGQQSVTGTDVQEDVNSHWAVKAETGRHCIRG
jgi:dolichyl-phosphate-mannose--protein O-mannosyl transferase